ncbi:MAG: hypothetical protein IT578_00905 [Verrucomicrobiae bacterium]|nr:hypothetical protein [Verrucomicrobiae bacterium]
MASFACPHLDVATDRCLLLKTDCVPGRAGCVLRGTSGFAVPAEQRTVEGIEARETRADVPPPPKPRRGRRRLDSSEPVVR